MRRGCAALRAEAGYGLAVAVVLGVGFNQQFKLLGIELLQYADAVQLLRHLLEPVFAHLVEMLRNIGYPSLRLRLILVYRTPGWVPLTKTRCDGVFGGLDIGKTPVKGPFGTSIKKVSNLQRCEKNLVGGPSDVKL